MPDFSTNHHQPTKHFRNQTNVLAVCKLSHKKLSKTQSSLLKKGLSFCPNHKLDLVNLCHETNEYTSLLRNKEFFHSKNSSNKSNRSTSPFKAASNRKPRLGWNKNLDFYILKIEKELDVHVHNLNTKTNKLHNILSNQHKALHDPKRYYDIVIKPADKGEVLLS